MEIYSEIKKIISSLKKRKKFSDIKEEKLFDLFQSIEVEYKDSLMTDEYHLSEIKRKAAIKKNVPGRRILKSVLMPVAAVAALIFLVISFNLYNNSSDIKLPVEIIVLKGDVSVKRDGNVKLLKKGDPIFKNDILITSEKSYGELKYKTARVKIEQNSELQINIASIDKNAQFKGRLLKGEIFVFVKKLKRNEIFILATNNSLIEVRGTFFSVRVDDKNSSICRVYKGTVRMAARLTDDYLINKSEMKKINQLFDENARFIMSGEKGETNFGENLSEIKNSIITMEKIGKNIVVKKKINSVPKKSLIAFADSIPGEGKVLSFLNKKRKDRVSVKGRRAYSYLISDKKSKLITLVGQDGIIECYENEDLKWTRNIHGRVKIRPLIMDNKLFILTVNGKIYSIGIDNNRILWKRTVHESGFKLHGFIYGKKALYLALSSGKLMKFSLTGKMIWSVSFKNGINRDPVEGKNLIFVSLVNGVVQGVDKNAGIKILKYKTGSLVSTMKVSGGNLLLGTDRGEVIIYNAKRDTDIKKSLNSRIIYITENSGWFYAFTASGNIYCMNEKFEVKWEANPGSTKIINIIIDRNNIYTATKSALYVLNADNGSVKWTYVHNGIKSKNIIFNSNKIFLLNDKNRLTSFKTLKN